MNYKAYGTVKDTPNRKVRKSQRFTVFHFNKKAKRVARKAERVIRIEQNS